jgi:hypothetical protein
VGRYIRDRMVDGSAMNRLVNRAQAVVPKPLQTFAKRLIVNDIPAMDPEAAAYLEGYFRPHNEQLEALTGLDLSVWRASRRAA